MYLYNAVGSTNTTLIITQYNSGDLEITMIIQWVYNELAQLCMVNNALPFLVIIYDGQDPRNANMSPKFHIMVPLFRISGITSPLSKNKNV